MLRFIISSFLIASFSLLALFFGDLLLLVALLLTWTGLVAQYMAGKGRINRKHAQNIVLASSFLSGILFLFMIFDTLFKLHHSFEQASLMSVLSLVMIWIPLWYDLITKARQNRLIE
ncbi:MAG: hypothetical protein J7J67_03595 [Thermoproteales archaeon]|nr:hypothetical protein [Thermoproteales archaeon]